ncbi:hypothetical protein V8C34DRAFT_319291 [Trichoderma compactum]
MAPKTTCNQPRVHVLGLGSIGTFTAHCLAGIPAPLTPSVTLLLHRPNLVDEYIKRGRKIRLETIEGEVVDSHNYHVEVLNNGEWHRIQAESGFINPAVQGDIIDHLIVSIGSGTVEAANEEVFTDPATKPSYLTGVIAHGVTLNAPFDITHTGFSATSLGPIPRSNLDTEETASSYLLEALPLIPMFNATRYSTSDVLQIQ